MTIFDSNLWISYYVKEDHNHNRAIEAFIANTDIVITEYIFLEVSTVLTLKLGSEKAASILTIIREDEGIILLHDSTLFERTFRSFIGMRYKHKLSFVDLSLLLLSDEYKIVSFDKELNKYLSRKAKNSGMN